MDSLDSSVRIVLLRLCVSYRIRHTEAVTGVTVFRFGGPRPWVNHGSSFSVPPPPWQEECCRRMLLGQYFSGRQSGMEIQWLGSPRPRSPHHRVLASYHLWVDIRRFPAYNPPMPVCWFRNIYTKWSHGNECLWSLRSGFFRSHGLLFQILRSSSVLNVHSLPPHALNLKNNPRGFRIAISEPAHEGH